MQKFDAVVKAKTFGDLIKHLNDVETSLMIQRDDLLEEMNNDKGDLVAPSIEELEELLQQNADLVGQVQALLITEVDKIYECEVA
ncbi:hypothetical protein [Bacillus wiedmannii]|uniref:hypothetical protein n=1 Tax=Bacillus wiedmannii TaxID=1890302 RepID=UPI000BEF7547|nr:hypothetical protein [Bacillus wiedmannii]PEL83277.1 hypothetical protein CN626_29655 [Bacillus wiedmannii]